jgi:hypothetical protein
MARSGLNRCGEPAWASRMPVTGYFATATGRWATSRPPKTSCVQSWGCAVKPSGSALPHRPKLVVLATLAGFEAARPGCRLPAGRALGAARRSRVARRSWAIRGALRTPLTTGLRTTDMGNNERPPARVAALATRPEREPPRIRGRSCVHALSSLLKDGRAGPVLRAVRASAQPTGEVSQLRLGAVPTNRSSPATVAKSESDS